MTWHCFVFIFLQNREDYKKDKKEKDIPKESYSNYGKDNLWDIEVLVHFINCNIII